MATKDPSALMELATVVLQDVWGYDAFRGVQKEVVHRLLVDGENALCLMPTGGGKSLCYQLPALCLPGLTVVVSPLIALMKDQVDALRKRNVAAASMDSSLTPDEMKAVRSQLKDKTLKLLYVAPERLANEMFISLMMKQEVSLLAVDESHCVSEWGPSFRPEYLKVARFAKEVEAQRVLCLTATATPSVVKDICGAENGFDIDVDKGVFTTGNYRPNLSLLIKPTFNLASKIALLVPFLKSRGAGGAIVYATTHSDAEKVVASLKEKGLESKFYHAGVPAEDRKATQDWFTAGQGIVVATIAFGMGIDKSDIRQVVHFMIPKTLENYSQEVGRAGRDGLPATCLMMPCATDLPILESFARGNTPSRNSIRAWLGQVFAAKPAADSAIDFSLYAQSTEFDITRNTLGLLYANLELQCELLRAGTPFYSTYAIKPSSEPTRFHDILDDNSPLAQAIRKHWKKGSTWCTLDIVSVIEGDGFDRTEIVRQINRWESSGCCETKVSNVRNRYLPLKKLPTTAAEIDKIADDMFQQMHEREEADVKRLFGTAAFVKRDGCFAHGLACYFGDETSVPNGECGSCSWCQTRKPISFDPKPHAALDEGKIKAVLAVCGVRDDARFLARLAFGISSPRITKLGLSRHPVFKSCETADFSALVARFEEECEKVGWQNGPVLSAAPPAKKGAFGAGKGGAGKGGSASASAAGTKRSSSTASGAKRGKYD
ncbi:ATP-dependent DNA helicase [Leucosporidium creatinivorum]|uniref:DNA 3'-5' helicase n=1 Tax=Leucosporidium creatinivorum TaxID=106004 RepID=A0A1Y2DXF9_9BASI|nr:ATP-dependent DNA helicase [Leucosporidium creatinivorum]